ncbi:putative secondary metabolism biosynthetic enzyme [Trichoderma asperellum]|nr:putative secondary metabolism biosynthetic enzyme [Trichoderma asperellum]
MNRVLSLFLHFAVAMSTSFKTLALHKDGADGAILTVTIKNTRSEVNVFCQETSIELNELVTVLQNDTSTKVVIFKSGNPEFFSAHYDIFPTPGEPDLNTPGTAAFNGKVFLNMSNLPQPVISMIDGPARGIGNEFLAACDMIFASKNARFSNFKATLGLHPGAGGVAWMPLHIGRASAMEFVFSGNDIDPKTAEEYGYVNKAFDTPEGLYDYVEKLAERIALFPLGGLSSIKRTVTDTIQPRPEQIAIEGAEWDRLVA